jgi:hypothetical protein
VISSPDTSGEQKTPYEALLGEIDEVLAEWRSLMQRGSMLALPPARLMDALPEIVPKLVRLAWSGATQVDDDLKERIARDHGLSRRADEVSVASIAEEWDALKRACARVLARDGFVNADEARHRIDLLIDDAIGYTLRGYYQQELDTLRGRGLERRDTHLDDRRRGGDRRERSEDR